MLKKFSTNVARAKQVAMTKIGQVESTVDTQFNQEEQLFREQYGRLKKLSKFIQNFQKSVAELNQSQNGISQMILDQYEQHHRMFDVATAYNNKSLKELEDVRQKLDYLLSENFLNPLSVYLSQYKLIDDRITERNKRLIDMDRYNNDLRAIEKPGASDPVKLQMAREKAENKTQEYRDLNDELLRDIPRLVQDRSSFIDCLFANLVEAQIMYLMGSASVLQSLQPGLHSINPGNPRSHPRVITDPAQSSYKKGALEELPPANPQKLQSSFNSQMPPMQNNPSPQPQMQPQMQPQIQPQIQPQVQPQMQPQMQPQIQPQMQPQGQSFSSQMYASSSSLEPQGMPFGQQPGGFSQGQPFSQAAPQAFSSQPVSQPFSQAAPQGSPFGAQPFEQPSSNNNAGLMKAQALYPFQGVDDTELTFQFNDVIIIHRQGGEWWEGELDGKRGLFPANYVKLI